MSNILLKRESSFAATFVPNTFIDEYMTRADGEFVKIYLYLLRCLNSPDKMFSISDTADKFDYTEKDVNRALKYWEKVHLLRLEFNSRNELSGILLTDCTSCGAPAAHRPGPPVHGLDTAGNAEPASAAGYSMGIADYPPVPAGNAGNAPAVLQSAGAHAYPAVSAGNAEPASASAHSMGAADYLPVSAGTSGSASAVLHGTDASAYPAVPAGNTPAVLQSAGAHEQPPKQHEYTAKELSQFANDETLQERLFVAERYLGHPLNDTETQTILFWLDKLQFSQDLIDYLLEYCAEKKSKNIQYMNAIAISWASQGIRTVARAKMVSDVHNHTVLTVMKAFGISSRSLVDYELDYIQKWHGSLGFSDEVISHACQKTIRSINKVSFSYADSILEDWNKQNIRTLKDIEQLDARFQKKQQKNFAAAKKASARPAKTASALVNSFTNFPQRTYNYEEIERQLLRR